MRRLTGFGTLLALFLSASASTGGEIHTHRDKQTGWKVYVLSQGDTVATLVPTPGPM